MDNKILSLKEKFVSELDKIDNLADIESIRVSYLGKKGSVTDLLKGMKELSNDERKAFGQKVNELKGLVNEKITEKTNELKEKEIQKEIELMPEFDLSMPPVMDRVHIILLHLCKGNVREYSNQWALPLKITVRL